MTEMHSIWLLIDYALRWHTHWNFNLGQLPGPNPRRIPFFIPSPTFYYINWPRCSIVTSSVILPYLLVPLTSTCLSCSYNCCLLPPTIMSPYSLSSTKQTLLESTAWITNLTCRQSFLSCAYNCCIPGAFLSHYFHGKYSTRADFVHLIPWHPAHFLTRPQMGTPISSMDLSFSYPLSSQLGIEQIVQEVRLLPWPCF